MTVVRRKQFASNESAVEIPPPSSELLELAQAVCEAVAELSKLRATIRLSEQEYRQAKAVAADAQHRHDRSQGAIALAELVEELSSRTAELTQAEAELCEAQRLLPDAEARVAALDARHRTLACELIKLLRASAASRYRCAAEDLKNARNLYTDLGLVLGEPDWHAIPLLFGIWRPPPLISCTNPIAPLLRLWRSIRSFEKLSPKEGVISPESARPRPSLWCARPQAVRPLARGRSRSAFYRVRGGQI